MVKRKNIREAGKISFSRAFQDFKAGDSVSVVIEKARPMSFPKRIQGRCGVIEERRGNSFVVSINDLEKEKKFIINPLHLKKINAVKSLQ
ncbi:50S ribosomal protein L21e [Candidatus Pacearchaeota archaeon]|nr:50S ribosomal protein L21e [Candidatus Pacearchaeota archaeon]MBI2057153.1 50S ribosomal protein L21e [Candidatus Pacearchaeota archaeon]